MNKRYLINNQTGQPVTRIIVNAEGTSRYADIEYGDWADALAMSTIEAAAFKLVASKAGARLSLQRKEETKTSTEVIGEVIYNDNRGNER